MVRVIYGIDSYEGFAAARSDTEFWLYDSSYNVIHHISGIHGTEWDHISIEGGDWIDAKDISNSEDLLKQRIAELELALEQAQLELNNSSDSENLLEQRIAELELALEQAQTEMNDSRELVGYLSGESSLIGELSVQNETEEEIPQLVGYLSIPDHIGIKYDGSYEVVPTSGFQMMYTEDKYMEDDVIVHPIPYAEVSNESGGYTATIGGLNG